MAAAARTWTAALLLLGLPAAPGLAQEDAAALVARMVAAEQVPHYDARARLVTSVRDTEIGAVQVRALGRRDGETARTLYQALWPATVKGQAVSFETFADRLVSGFLFAPPEAVTTLSADALDTRLFGSELMVEDLVEGFWNWPQPVAREASSVKGQPCQVVDLRPPPRAPSAYALVRACISAERALPLLVEKLDAHGVVVRRFRVEKAVKRDGRWVTTRLSIENVVTGYLTEVDVSRGNRDRVVEIEEFSLPWIRRLGAPPKGPPEAER